MSLSMVTALYGRKLQKSWVPGKELEGNCKRAEFLEKDWKEIAEELSSWKRTGRKLQKSWVPAKELEGNYKRAGFLEKNRKEIAKSGFPRKNSLWLAAQLHGASAF